MSLTNILKHGLYNTTPPSMVKVTVGNICVRVIQLTTASKSWDAWLWQYNELQKQSIDTVLVVTYS